MQEALSDAAALLFVRLSVPYAPSSEQCMSGLSVTTEQRALIGNPTLEVEYTGQLCRTATGRKHKKLSYRRGTTRCVVSVIVLPVPRNSVETTCTTSPEPSINCR